MVASGSLNASINPFRPQSSSVVLGCPRSSRAVSLGDGTREGGICHALVILAVPQRTTEPEEVGRHSKNPYQEPLTVSDHFPPHVAVRLLPRAPDRPSALHPLQMRSCEPPHRGRL